MTQDVGHEDSSVFTRPRYVDCLSRLVTVCAVVWYEFNGSRQAVVFAAELQELQEHEPTIARDREDIAEWITLGSGVI